MFSKEGCGFWVSFGETDDSFPRPVYRFHLSRSPGLGVATIKNKASKNKLGVCGGKGREGRELQADRSWSCVVFFSQCLAQLCVGQMLRKRVLVD